MRITKYEHATVTVDKGDNRVIIDPGNFLASLTDFAGIGVVVITHEHPDHWSAENLNRVRQSSPDAVVLAPEGVARAAATQGLEDLITVVAPGDVVEAGGFRFEFFGGKHAVIHESIPIIDNVGVLIDDAFYYPGDSYAVPVGREIAVLAAPLGAPWLKIADAIDFVLAVKPALAFGTHDMTLSAIGRDMHNSRLEWATAQGGGVFTQLETTQSLDA